MDILLGAFGMAVITGVFTFATLMINKLFDQIKFFQDQLMPTVARQQTVLEELKRCIETLSDESKQRGGSGGT